MPVEEFLELFPEILKGDFNKVAFDFSGKETLNSSGLGELLLVHDRCHERGVGIVLTGVNRKVSSLLDMTGTEKFFIMKEDKKGFGQG